MDDAKETVLLIATTMVVLVAFALTVLAVMLIYRRRKMQHLQELQLMNERFGKELLQAQLEVQQHTMQFIGREIHDNVGQKLTLAFLRMQKLHIEEINLQERVDAIASIIDDSLADLRSLSRSLIDSNRTGETDLCVLIGRECEKIQLAELCAVSFSKGDLDSCQAGPEIKNFVIRIFQEFAQNSVKHAECSQMQVSMKETAEGLMLTVEDNGKGFRLDETLEQATGVGLLNMKRRAEMIGGTLILTSTLGHGTKMTLLLPQNKYISSRHE